MRLFLLFLVGCFLLGGTRRGQAIAGRPAVVMLGCVLVGALFYSYRFVR